MRLHRVVHRGPCLFWVVAWLFSATSLEAQFTQIRPLDIKAGVDTGSIRMTIVPSWAGDSTKPFDGNSFTELAMHGSDSLIITLQFDTLVRIEKSKVFCWNPGQWSLEVANTLTDLDSASGSYEKLVSGRTFSFFIWDSSSFPARSVRFVRLRTRNSSDTSMYLGEWTLENTVTFTHLVIFPYPPRIIPGVRLQLRVNIADDQNRFYPYFLSQPLTWRTGDSSIVTVDNAGKLTGIKLGTTTVTATAQGVISGTSNVSVESDFRPTRVAPMTVKVALVLQDPVVPPSYTHIHEIFHWRDPRVLSNDLVRHFREASDSVVNFQFVEIVDATRLFTRFYGNFLSITDYVKYLNEPGWPTLKAASDSGKLWFDYREFVKYYQYDLKRNNGVIDEVWVFAAPYLGMYESQLLGPTAFWWNSPPIRDGTALAKLLSVMGLNYERGVDQAFHSFGHRVESAMSQAYFEVQGNSPDPTPWGIFTRIDRDMPGQAQVGNVHFPPNGTHDYDYGNTTLVRSYAENWYRFPYLFDQHSDVNISTWYFTPGDPLAEGLDHLGYLRWWYNHLPRYTGITDGILNNWWHYALDYEGAMALAKVTPVVTDVNDRNGAAEPLRFDLEQNFPNPFNPATILRFTLPQRAFVRLKIFDILGREVQTLVSEELGPGTYDRLWEPKGIASGVYFCRLSVTPVAGRDILPAGGRDGKFDGTMAVRKLLFIK